MGSPDTSPTVTWCEAASNDLYLTNANLGLWARQLGEETASGQIFILTWARGIRMIVTPSR